MKILMISTDRKILEENSPVRNRILEYGKLVDELNIVIFNSSTRVSGIKYQVSSIPESNVTLYPTNSRNRWFYIYDAIKIGLRIIENLTNKNEILVSCQDPFETGVVGWWITRKTGAKLHLQIHTDFLSNYFVRESCLNRVRVCIAKFVIPKANGVRVVSERIKKSLSAISYQLSARVNVLPIFVDTEKIKNTPVKFDLHKKYPQFDFIFLVASRLEREKNIEMVIESFGEIVKKYPKAGLVIVGDGSKREELSAISYKLSANTVFEGWSDDLISYYKTADLFLSSSNYEGFGMSLVEAISCGCPVLTTDVGLVGDILAKENSLICDIGDKNCFVSKMIFAIENGNKIKEMNKKAQESISQKLILNEQEHLNKMKESWENCLK